MQESIKEIKEIKEPQKEVESIIVKTDGSPFADERAAAIQKSKLTKEGIDAEVIPIDGGFALRVKPQKKRIPLGRRNVLTFPEQKGYVLRVVNDINDRIERFDEAGWEVVKSPKNLGDDYAGKGTHLGSAVTKQVGGGTIGVLMRKRADWYEEDYAEKQKVVDRSEEGMLNEATQGHYGELTLGNKTRYGKTPRR